MLMITGFPLEATSATSLWHKPNPALCCIESDQRHAQHLLKMLVTDFSCGSYQTTSERSMVLYSLYQTDMSPSSNRYLFVGSKIGEQKWQPHILCKTMLFFTSRLTPLVRLATTCSCTEGDTRRNANSIHIVIPAKGNCRPGLPLRALSS